MDQKIDDKIKSILLENDIDMPEECQNRINDTLKRLPVKKNKKWQMRLRPAVVIVVTCLLMSSITVFAAVNYVRQRMEKLPDEVKDSYYEGVQKSTAAADGYSREMTDDEKERMEELKVNYENGTFPVKTLPIVKTQSDADGSAELYFTEDTSIFNLPARELTDEELLEIIDFYYSRDYSLNEKNKQENTVTESPDKIIETAGMDEEKAIELARVEVENIYETDCEKFEATVEFDDMGGNGNRYRVVMTDNETMSVYNVTVDADRKMVAEVLLSQQSDKFTSGIEVDQDKITAKYEDALEILTKRMGIELSITQSTCEYNNNSDGTLERGVVSYLFEMEDGTGYVMKYNYWNDVFYDILMTDYDSYRLMIDQSEDDRQERDVVRKIIQMQ